MKVTETSLKGCYIIEPAIFRDERGLFFESFNEREFEKITGNKLPYVQDNHSISSRGVLRGLHYQKDPHGQAKIVRVISGEVIDVVVDIRPGSNTYGSYFKTRLSSSDGKMLYIPRGMAHGFLALEDNTVFVYKCDNYYHKESERGIIYNDPSLNIDWEFPSNELILSEKDRALPQLSDLIL